MLVISDFTKQDKDLTRVQAVRQRFKLARKFLNPLYPLLVKGYGNVKHTKQKAFGRAMSHTLTNVIKGDFPDFRVDPSQAKLSNGMLLQLHINHVRREGNKIRLTWDTKVSSVMDYSQWDDQVLLCVYDLIGEQAAINEHTVLRQDGLLEIDLPSILHGKQVHLYLLLHDREAKFYSRSQYLGLL